MEYRRLGLTNIMISRVGFGCWAIGGHGYGHVDDQVSIKAVQKALDVGVNFFDTSNVYGFGHSEEILSKALGPQRNKVIIATKFGVNWDESGRIYRDCSRRCIMRSLEGSLDRLRIDCVPLYQLHWHDGRTPIEEVMETLLECRDAGKILHIGLCNVEEYLVAKAIGFCRVESYQCLYNLVRRENENIIRSLSGNLAISVLVYGALGRGIFSAKFRGKPCFDENDTRVRDPDFQGARYYRNLAIAERLNIMAKRYGKSPSQLAIRWVLENSNVDCVITGVKTPEQIADNAGSVGWSLENYDKDMIDSMISDISDEEEIS